MRAVCILAMFAISWASLGLGAEPLAPEELQKQNEFKKAYATLERLDRMKALQLLEGATHPSTWELLAAVAQTDNYKEVRTEAFKMLSTMPARDPNLAHILATIFSSIKPNDTEIMLEFMPHLKNSEFKYEIIEAMADTGYKMRYPDLVSGSGYRPSGMVGGGQNGDPNVQNRKQRAAFEKFLEIFNQITKSDVKELDKNTPGQLRKWWEPRRNKMLLADKEITDKYKAEDRAKADKNNPLIPKTAAAPKTKS